MIIYTIENMNLDMERVLYGCHDATGEIIIDENKRSGVCDIKNAALT